VFLRLSSPRLEPGSSTKVTPAYALVVAAQHPRRFPEPQGASRQTVNGLAGAVVELLVDDVSAGPDDDLCPGWTEVAAVLFASWSSSAPMDLVAIVSGGNITPERRKTLLDGVKV